MGGDAIFDELQEHLGVGNGETTEDGKVTLEHIECNAACDFAPVVMVNWEFFDNQTPVEREAAGRRPARAAGTVEPTRGAPLCTFKETARILAGFPDERAGRRRGERRRGTRLAGRASGWPRERPHPRAWSTRATARRRTAGRPRRRRRPSTSARTTRHRTRRPPTRPTRPGPSPRRGSDDLGTRAEASQPREAARTRAVGLLGRAASPGRWTPTAGTRGTRACARRSPCRRTT